MKIRIHMMGNINLICEYENLNDIMKDVRRALKKEDLIEIKFPWNASSKYIQPEHIIAIEEFIEIPAPAAQDAP